MKLKKIGKKWGGRKLYASLRVVGLIVSLPIVASAATTTLRVVSNVADKSRPGWEDAYTSIHDALAAMPTSSAAQGYNTILVASGTYNISETISVPAGKKWIHFRSINIDTGEEDPEHTILDGGGTTAIMESVEVKTFVSGFTFANGYVQNEGSVTNRAAGYTDRGANGYGTISNCIFRGNVAVNTRATCISSSLKFSQLILNCVFSNNTHTITIPGERGCTIYVDARDTPQGYNDPLVKDCLFVDNRLSAPSAHGSTAYFKNLAVENCTFLTNHFTFTESGYPTSGGYVSLGTKTTLRDCRFTCNGVYSQNNNTVAGTVVYVGGSECSFIDCEFSDIRCDGDQNKDTSGIVEVSGVNHAQFVGCRFLRNYMDGKIAQIKMSNSCSNLIRNCLFTGLTRKNAGTTIIRQSGCNKGVVGVEVANCTFVNNGDNHSFGNEQTSSCTNYLVNSVFTAQVGRPGTLANATQVVASNCCFRTGKYTEGEFDHGNFFVNGESDLKLLDIANGDCHLRRNSPLRERGMMLPWMADGIDIDGNPRVASVYGIPCSRDASALPDVGCYECLIPIPGLIITIQ